jgi:hypothetical protein
VKVRVLPRDVAAGIITGSVASLGWAVGAATLLLAMPMLIETLARVGRVKAAPLPFAILVITLACLGLVVWRARPWAVAAYLVVGYLASVSYELLLIPILPMGMSEYVYLLNRPAVALVLVGLAARTPLIGIGWSLLGLVVSTGSTLTVSAITGLPFQPGWGPGFAVVVSLAAYVTLWRIQIVQRRRIPNVDELEAESARITRGEDLARRTTAVVHDTLLNDLSIIMNAPEELDQRAVQRLREDFETLSSAEWLSERSQLTVVDAQDTFLRNEIATIISGFQWRGLSVHVTGSGDGIYRLKPATAMALVDALRAALENVSRHSGASIADVELVYGPGRLTMMVTDKGVGFDPDAVPGDRLGIRASIESRIVAVDGTARIWSSPGSGTSIVMTVPVQAVLREHESARHQELG